MALRYSTMASRILPSAANASPRALWSVALSEHPVWTNPATRIQAAKISFLEDILLSRSRMGANSASRSPALSKAQAAGSPSAPTARPEGSLGPSYRHLCRHIDGQDRRNCLLPGSLLCVVYNAARRALASFACEKPGLTVNACWSDCFALALSPVFK